MHYLDEELGGVFALSGMQGLAEPKQISTNSTVSKTPLFLYNGFKDTLVSAKNAKASYKFCHSYENVTMHFDKKLDKNEVSKKEMDEVYQWISGLKHTNKISNKNVYELHDENN
jgi:predicted esterase